MVETRPKPMTEEELMAVPKDGRKFELVDGEAKEVPTGWEHEVIGARLLGRLGSVANALGYLTGSSAGFRMKGGNVRAPDVGFVLAERAPSGAEAKKFFDGAPDLAVEVVSPTEDREDAFRKIGEYFESGARQVWIVQPRSRTVTVYHSMDRVRTFEADEELEGGDLLPGFRCAVSDLFVTL
jgi:Uma2 family endonuclease